MKRYNIEDVKKYVEKNSNCILLDSEYKNYNSKLKFKCKCGEIFETSFEKFKTRNKRQCNKCGRKNISEYHKLRIDDIKKYVEENSNCILLSTEYVNAHSKLLFQCECGNTFLTPFKHFKDSNQRQCQECGKEIRFDKRRHDYSDVKKYIEDYNCKLISDNYKNINQKLEIQCNCGNLFYTSYNMFKNLDINCCKRCREEKNSISKGEIKIEQWLNDNKIKYETQYTFDSLKNSHKLRFDFAILNKENNIKLLIEYDGKQHYGLGNFTSDEDEMIAQYNRVLQNDYIKNEFCFTNGYSILRIPYNRYSQIESILERNLL